MRPHPDNASLCRSALKGAPNSEDQAMADELSDAEIAMDSKALYREETFTDRRVGTLQRLTPVTPTGDTVAARPVICVGKTQVHPPPVALLLSFEVEATSLDDAVAKFGELPKQALGCKLKRL